MSENEPLPVRVIEEAVHLLGASIKGVVPPSAQMHFLNAQRELLLAVADVIDHNAQRSRASTTRSKPGAKPKPSRRPSKVALD